MIFGVTDMPRLPKGLSAASLKQFEKIDPEKVTGFLLDIFSPSITWEQGVYEVHGVLFGVSYISEGREKPIIRPPDIVSETP